MPQQDPEGQRFLWRNKLPDFPGEESLRTICFGLPYVIVRIRKIRAGLYGEHQKFLSGRWIHGLSIHNRIPPRACIEGKMAEKKKKKSKKDKKKKEIEKKQDFVKQLKIAYRSLEDTRKFYLTILLPLIIMGLLVFLMPFILNIILPVQVNFNPLTFIIGGTVPILIGVLYPFIT